MNANQQQFAMVAPTPSAQKSANDRAFDLRRSEWTMNRHLTAKRAFRIIAATVAELQYQFDGIRGIMRPCTHS
jgi:hypothetical protein